MAIFVSQVHKVCLISCCTAVAIFDHPYQLDSCIPTYACVASYTYYSYIQLLQYNYEANYKAIYIAITLLYTLSKCQTYGSLYEQNASPI